MSSSQGATPTSTTASTSSTDLFPTSTASTAASDDGKKGTNVYYLVFLGVLIVLLLLAACLALRAFRIRRRYRTATQLAIARGGPLPPFTGNDYWGLGGLSGWTAEGLDRFGVPINQDAGRRGGKVRWQKIPKMWESQVDDKEEFVEGKPSEALELAQPIMVYSLRTETEDQDVVPPPIPPDYGPYSQPASRHSFSPITFMRRGRVTSPDLSTAAAVPPVPAKESDREMEVGEATRVAILIQMPTEEGETRRPRSDRDSLEEEEGTGWEPGMELGIWEGVVDYVSGVRTAI